MENRSTFYKMKVVTNIEVPQQWQITNDWDSHRPLLYLASKNTQQSITEFGCGYGSTKLLQSLCYDRENNKESNRIFVCHETNKEWADIIRPQAYWEHSYLSINPTYITRLIFIDSAPAEERKYLIAKHSWSAYVIVVHDTELSADYVYGMKEILNTFKYRLDFRPEGLPHTSAVSNFINIQDWI